MKVQVSKVSDNDKWLKDYKKVQLKKLAEYKAKGFTKEQCYSKFTKVFVDKNY